MTITQEMSTPRADRAMLKVILAQPRGFCAGVVRAIDIVERALERYEAPVYVRHEIVHNRHVVDKLRRKGAVFVEDLDEVPPGALTIFSAHGVARSVQDEARLRALPTLDATCPLVTKVHVQGRRYARSGRTLILIGHAGHAEVIGTMGQVDAAMHLVSTPADVAALPLADDAPVAYVTQTTLSVDDTRHVPPARDRRRDGRAELSGRRRRRRRPSVAGRSDGGGHHRRSVGAGRAGRQRHRGAPPVPPGDRIAA